MTTRSLPAAGGLALVVLAALALAAPPAHADQPLWELGLGVGGLSLPHYRGSNQSNSWLLPVPYFAYRGTILRADRDGTRAMLFDNEHIDVDVSLSASAPAKSDDDIARQGMPDLQPTFEIGPKLNWHLARGADWKFDLRLPLRAVLTIESRPRSVGWTFAPVLNLDTRVNGFGIGLQAGPLWGDRRLNSHFYEVAPAYASAARPAYGAPGGYAGWQATAALSRRSGRLWTGAYVRADSVAGAVFEGSPLVKSRQQWSAGFAVSWVFAVSGERVPGSD